MRRLFLAACVLLTGPWALHGSDFSGGDIEFFEKSVRPLLATRCYECHGAKQQKGNLRLDHPDFFLKGGDSGPAIVAGNADVSLLVEAINYASYEMPPTGKLNPDEIAILTKWVSLGAPWPDEAAATSANATGFDLEARKQHWSFQPIVASPPPDVSNGAWPRDSIDRFVLARLEAGGLRPADDADKRTLLRRVYFDLIGLPPSSENVEAFLTDTSPNAFAKVIDELLASPHFGERWGRHWLDLARYAETLGHEFDYPLPHAWRYRDYVVRAFNDDLPYDDFVREHIAGDLLPTPRTNATEGYNESIIATGFWHLHEDVHSPVDVRLAEAIRYDNQIDVFGKTFLGLTVACARCHDHKFDAITAADYYALAGFLKSSRRNDAALDPHGEIASAVRKLTELREAADALREAFPADPSVRHASPLRDGDVLFEDFNGDSFDGWIASGWAFGDKPVGVADSSRLAKQLTGSLRSQNFTIEHDAVLIRVAGEKARIRLVVDGYQMDIFSALLFAELTQKIDTGGEWKWLRIQGDLANHKGHRGYFELLDENDGWLAVDEIRFTDEPGLPASVSSSRSNPVPLSLGRGVRSEGRGFASSFVFDQVDRSLSLQDGGQPSSIPSPPAPLPSRRLRFGAEPASAIRFQAIDWRSNPAPFSLGRRVEDEGRADARLFSCNRSHFGITEVAPTCSPHPQPLSPEERGARMRDHSPKLQSATRERGVSILNFVAFTPSPPPPFPPSETELARLTAEADALASRIPQPTFVHALQDGPACDELLFIRGSHENTAGPVERRFLEALGGTEGVSSTANSRRLDLAERLLADDDPFPARVMANRVWQHLFGEGLVRSVDNFGVLGDVPSHPELLDHLAISLREDAWSIKRLIRRIVLSRTYQQASVPQTDTAAKIAEADPTNRLLHAQRIRRLEGEVLRDAMLAVSGELDPQLGGTSVPVHLTEFMQGRGRPKDSGPLDGAGRRSLYIKVQRNFLTPMLTAFDYPPPATTVGRRNVSNVPAQALILLNDPFVIDQAHDWARRDLAMPATTPADRIARLYESAYSRPPSEAEMNAAIAFLGSQSTIDEQAWANLCHVLFNAKEFVFVR